MSDYNDLETEEEFNKRKEVDKEQWFNHWSDGIRYDVRILDGGAPRSEQLIKAHSMS